MRFWPRREDRQADPQSATDVAINSLMARAVGTTTRPETLAAAEIAAGLFGRAFAAAHVSGSIAARLLTRATLELIGRSLALSGELVLVPGDGPALFPAASFSVRGNADPATWLYRIDMAGPSRSVTRTLPGDAVLHPRINVDPARPWRGRSAAAVASATARTAADAEETAETEARWPVSRLLPILQGSATPSQRDELAAGWAAEIAKGGVFVLPATPHRGERPAGKANDITALHPDPTDGHLRLRERASLDLLNATGVPSALADPEADAGAQREAFRRFVHSTIEPLARVVEEEVRVKLGVECDLDFGRLFAADLAGRTRGLKQLVESGVALGAALDIVGLGGDDA